MRRWPSDATATCLPGLMAISRECIVAPPSFSRATFSTSWSPTLTPPVAMMASHRDAAARRRSARMSWSSAPVPRSTGRNPSDPSWASSAGRLASRIFPGIKTASGAASSSPVDRTPTAGRGQTSSAWMPRLASTPMWAGPSCVPGVKTSAPAAMSSPGSRTFVPGLTDSSMSTASAPSSALVRSTMHTASAPGGISAPVIIRIASPCERGAFGPSPAATVPVTRRRTGAVATSAAFTAYPSIAALAKRGTGSVACTVSAVTYPSALPIATRRGASGVIAARTRRRASATGINVVTRRGSVLAQPYQQGTRSRQIGPRSAPAVAGSANADFHTASSALG